MTTPRQRELRKQNRLLVRQERLCERDISGLIKTMSDEIARRYSPGSVDAMLQLVDGYAPKLRTILARRILQSALIFGDRTLERIGDIAKSYYPVPPGTGPVRGGAEDFVEHARQWAEAKGFREIFEGAIRAWTELHALERATTITGTLKEAVRAILLGAQEDGVGEAGVAQLIRLRIGRTMSSSSAARIARTEMHTAAMVGNDEAARSTALTMVKEWGAAEDRRTRQSHAIADGQERPMDTPFDVGLAKLMFPGDPTGPAREIINCRCIVLHHPVINGVVMK